MTLNIARIQLLIRALESGEFSQTQRQLRRQTAVENTTSYCCLGVGCELYSQKVGGFWQEWDTFVADYETQPDYFNPGETISAPVEEDCRLPTAVGTWFGVPFDAQTRLIHFNDGEERTFKDIAAYLRRRIREQKKTGIVTWPEDIQL
jgi:hypothetical protein